MHPMVSLTPQIIKVIVSEGIEWKNGITFHKFKKVGCDFVSPAHIHTRMACVNNEHLWIYFSIVCGIERLVEKTLRREGIGKTVDTRLSDKEEHSCWVNRSRF